MAFGWFIFAVIKVTNLSTFNAEVEKWFAAVEKAAAEAAVGLAQVALDEILENSPQYSGDFVANWKVGNSVTSDFTMNAVGGMNSKVPFKRGDNPAIAYAKSQAKWPTPSLGKAIYLYNNAKHDEPYAPKIEKGEIKFRDVNEGADHPVRKAMLNVSFLYTNIGPVQLDGLRKYSK